ncbi:hypothetical protein EDD16DRAFT_1488484, partial [Pisolithus croceorrhizus]
KAVRQGLWEGVGKTWMNNPLRLQYGWMDTHDNCNILHIGRIGDPDVIGLMLVKDSEVHILRSSPMPHYSLIPHAFSDSARDLSSRAATCTSDGLVRLTAGLAMKSRTARGHRFTRNVVPLYLVS